MKKLLALVTLSCCLLSATSASAQLPSDAEAVTFNVGWSSSKLKQLDDTYNGWGLNAQFSKILANQRWAFDFSLGYFVAEKVFENPTDEIEKLNTSFTAIPLTLSGRYLINLSEKFVLYAGAGVGAQLGNVEVNTLETDGNTENERQPVSDFTVSIPLGLYFKMGATTYLNVSYQPYFVPDSDVTDVTHTVIIGIMGTM